MNDAPHDLPPSSTSPAAPSPTLSEQIREKHSRYLMPSTLSYYSEPIVVDRAAGVRVYDTDGREYLDFFGGILTVSLQHADPDVNGAIRVQLDRLTHLSTLYPNLPVVKLAETMAGIAPGDISQSFFVASGTEADEMAVMLAMSHTGRSELIALRNGYSGRSMLAQSLTAHSNWRVLPTQIAGIKHAAEPNCYRCPFNQTYPGCGLACAKDIERLIQYTTTGQIAGFLAEPIQGVGGFVVPPKEYFQVAVEIVRKYGGLFIADEVQTGFGRTGDKWWGIEHWGVTPDIITMAKGMANGMPAANCMTTPEIARSLPRLTISTFGGNPVSMAAAQATIDKMAAEDIPGRAARLGERLGDALRALQEKYPHNLGDVRGMGLMWGIEVVVDELAQDRTPDPALTNRIFEAARNESLLLGKGGRFGNVFRIAPPMLIAEVDLDHGLAAFDRALAAAGAR
jgi:alanine-glyoxylate transaminase/(R)-3-amino-2-methylpropionate-pyruvate transaminase